MNAKRMKRERAPIVTRLADAAVTVPVAAAHVVLGATVLAARSLRNVARPPRRPTRHRGVVSTRRGGHTRRLA